MRPAVETSGCADSLQLEKKSLNWTRLVVEALVDFGDFLNPALALKVIQFENLCVRPVKVISNIRYLLIEPL
jgi:hypothetical protein